VVNEFIDFRINLGLEVFPVRRVVHPILQIESGGQNNHQEQSKQDNDDLHTGGLTF